MVCALCLSDNILQTSVLRVYFQPPIWVNTGLHQLFPVLNQGLFPGWQDLVILYRFSPPVPVCRLFNKPEGPRCTFNLCKNAHACALCKGQHARAECRARSGLPKGPGCDESSDILHQDNSQQSGQNIDSVMQDIIIKWFKSTCKKSARWDGCLVHST